MRISDWSSDVCSSDLIVQSRFHSGDDLGMLAHREVVVGTPDGDRFGTAVTGKAACVGEGALVTQDVDEHPVAPLAVELCQRGIKDCVVPLLPTARWRFSNGKYCSALWCHGQASPKPVQFDRERKCAVYGKGVYERVDLGGRRNYKKK